MRDTNDELIRFARLIGNNWSLLLKLIKSKNCCAHFRPKRDGFSLVSLFPASAQCGRRRSFRTIATLEKTFEREFQKYCADRKAKKDSSEARVQSHIIREAYRHGRELIVFAEGQGSPVSFRGVQFVMDEIAVPGSMGKGDILAVRRFGNESQPVAMEIKYDRRPEHRVELIAQLDTATKNIQENLAFYHDVFGALLRWDDDIALIGDVERWIVWPKDPVHGDEFGVDGDAEYLADLKIGVIQYRKLDPWRYEFHVGTPPGLVTP